MLGWRWCLPMPQHHSELCHTAQCLQAPDISIMSSSQLYHTGVTRVPAHMQPSYHPIQHLYHMLQICLAFNRFLDKLRQDWRSTGTWAHEKGKRTPILWAASPSIRRTRCCVERCDWLARLSQSTWVVTWGRWDGSHCQVRQVKYFSLSLITVGGISSKPEINPTANVRQKGTWKSPPASCAIICWEQV